MGSKNIDIGIRIKMIRQTQGITQKQLADKLNVSQTAIALWENGARGISLELIDDLAEIFQTSASYILFGESDIEDTVYQKKTLDAQIESAKKRLEHEPSTLAAHFDGEEYTEEEIEEIKKFAEFVKSKRNNNN